MSIIRMFSCYFFFSGVFRSFLCAFISKALMLVLHVSFILHKTSVFCVIHYFCVLLFGPEKEVEKEWKSVWKREKEAQRTRQGTKKERNIQNTTAINLKLAPDIWTITYTSRGIKINVELCLVRYFICEFSQIDQADLPRHCNGNNNNKQW